MIIPKGFWKDWEVLLQYTDKNQQLPEHNPTHLTAKQTRNKPLDVVYAEVEWERPFEIVVRANYIPEFDISIKCTIDGRGLNSGKVGIKRASCADSFWHDKDDSGCTVRKNYKFSRILFFEDGPLPEERLYYGSIVVRLEAGKGSEPYLEKPKCYGRPMGFLNSSLESRTTDSYVDGDEVGPGSVIWYSQFKHGKTINASTTIIKYGSRNALINNNIIPRPTRRRDEVEDVEQMVTRSQRARLTYGGNTYRPSAKPLTVVYDPEA